MADNGAPRLCNRLRELRFRRDEMTQQDLARRVGVTRQTIIALEAGKYAPSLLLAFRLAAALGVRIEDVFQYEAAAPSSDQPSLQRE
jgi:putative transcriptional regulator